MASTTGVPGSTNGRTVEPAVAPDESLGPEPRRCLRHPNRETLVSCGRCGRPFCPECLVHTPAGQRCYECAGIRRRAASSAAASGLAKAFAVVVLGSAISSIAGLMGLLIGAASGDMAGRMVGPYVNRHNRRVLYPVCIALFVVGTLLGWSIPALIRVTTTARGGVDLTDLLFVLVAVSYSLVHSFTFWLFVIIFGAVGYQRIR
jgi:hypothetical protein